MEEAEVEGEADEVEEGVVEEDLVEVASEVEEEAVEVSEAEVEEVVVDSGVDVETLWTCPV